MQSVVAFLRKQGITVWVDNERLKPGTSAWEAEIERAIPNSYAIVVLLSPDAKDSAWVRREITLADQSNIKIYPALIRGNENNAIFLRLIASQYIDIREDKKEAGLYSFLKREQHPATNFAYSIFPMWGVSVYAFVMICGSLK